MLNIHIMPRAFFHWALVTKSCLKPFMEHDLAEDITNCICHWDPDTNDQLCAAIQTHFGSNDLW